MVVGILEAGLECVVVDIGHRALGAHPVDAHGLEFEVGHSACSVLCEGLVDAYADVGAFYHLARNEVILDDLFSDSESHDLPPWYISCFFIYL